MNSFSKFLVTGLMFSAILISCGSNPTPTAKTETGIEYFDAKRTKYTTDDTFDDYVCNGGLIVYVQYSDYTEKALEKSAFAWTIKDASNNTIDSSSPFDIKGEYRVNVSYKEFALSYSISVKENTSSKLLSISASNYTSEVVVDCSYSFDGTITAFYENGTSNPVTSYSTFSSIDTSSVGEKELSISYKEGRITKTITAKIYVLSSPHIYKENEIQLQYPSKGQVIDACDQRYNQYLSATDDREIVSMLEKYSLSSPEGKTISLSWKSNGSSSYTVHVSNDDDFENESTYTVSTNSLELKNLIPNKNYYWKVTGTKTDDSSVINCFTTNDGTVRFISAGQVQNIRDFGGWKTKGNKTIKYGMLYRGNCLNGYNGLPSLSEEGKAIFNNELKINTEIDFRTQNKDDNNQTKNYFDANKPYVKATISQYTYVLDATSFADLKLRKGDEYVGNGSPSTSSFASIKTVLETLANTSSYPVYMHCNVGADRTGTMSLILGGLLGVSYDDLMRDYELTSFSSASGKRYRSSVVDGVFNKDSIYKSFKDGNFIAMQVYYDAIMHYYSNGGDFQQACENFVKNYMNVSNDTITNIRESLLID